MSLLGFKEWKIFENEGDGESISKSALLVGATNHTAYNKSAGKTVNSDTVINIEGVDTLNDSKSISRKKGTSIKEFLVGPKSEKGKDYLKIGSIVLNGDSGNVEKVKVSLRELLTNELEASGNGIYALCRAIEYAYKYKVGQGSPIHIVLNQPSKTPVVMFASSGKSLGDPIAGWNGMVHAVATTGNNESVILPTKANKESDTYTKRYSKREYNTMIETANMFPTPRIFANTKEERIAFRKDMIANSSQFDISKWSEENKGKQIKDINNARKVMSDFCKRHYKQFLTTEADRFVFYLDKIAKKSGIDPSLLKPIVDATYAWRDKWSANEARFLTTTRSITDSLFRKVTYTTGKASSTSANAETKDLEIGGF